MWCHTCHWHWQYEQIWLSNRYLEIWLWDRFVWFIDRMERIMGNFQSQFLPIYCCRGCRICVETDTVCSHVSITFPIKPFLCSIGTFYHKEESLFISNFSLLCFSINRSIKLIYSLSSKMMQNPMWDATRTIDLMSIIYVIASFNRQMVKRGIFPADKNFSR